MDEQFEAEDAAPAGRITAIEKQKRRQRFDVYLDGALAFSLGPEIIFERGLSVGLELTAPVRREIEAEDQRRSAIADALRILSLQPRSEKDLRDRLKRRGWHRPAVDAAMARMRELGYLNDGAYARLFVEARQSATPRSRRALAFELQQRGIDRETAGDAIEPVSDADAAYEAAQRRLRALRSLDRPTFERRLGNFLAARGFGYGVARATIDRCWRELTEPDVE